jgi:hypothetical protein
MVTLDSGGTIEMNGDGLSYEEMADMFEALRAAAERTQAEAEEVE